MSSFDLVEAIRQLANMIRPGVIAEVDHNKALVRVRSGELLTGWLPYQVARAGQDRTWWSLEVGEQVVVISPDGDLAQGYVLGSFYHSNAQPPSNNPDKTVIQFSDTGRLEYDRKTNHLDIALPDGATVNLIANGGITFTGDLQVFGHITASGDIADRTRSMAADRGIYNGHSHSGVLSGNGSTGTPNDSQ